MIIERKSWIEEVEPVLVQEAFVASVEHFVVPKIQGLDASDEYPVPPLRQKHRVTIYERIKSEFRPILIPKITEFVGKALQSLSDAELQLLAVKVKTMVRLPEMRWQVFPQLLKDEILFYKQLQAQTNRCIDFPALHDLICPIMQNVEENHGLNEKICLREILDLNDRGL